MFVVVSISRSSTARSKSLDEKRGKRVANYIVHIYGSYDSRQKAQYQMAKMRQKDLEEYPHELPILLAVCKVLELELERE